MSFPQRLNGLTTREAIADAIYRCTAAYDENDFDLLKSATTEDCVFDAAGQVMNGRDEIKSTNFDKVSQLDTTHFITNLRINVENDAATTASVTCNALAQHYPAGTGLTADKRLLGGTKYVIDMVKDEADGLWKVKKWVLKIVWAEGDYSVVR